MYIDLNLTSVCNYGCLYCSEGKNPNMPDKSRILNSQTKVTLEDFDRLIKGVKEKRPNEDFTIAFWGGEPFINWDFAKKVMNLYKDDHRISFIFYSNGYYIQKYINEIVEYNNLLGNKVSDMRPRLFIQISYDGKVINDVERLTKSGKSTSQRCVDAWKLLRENNIDTKFKSTVTPRCFKYMFDAFKEFVELGTDYFPTPDAFSDYDFENEEKYFKELAMSLTKIARYIYENKIDPHLFRWFNYSRALCQAGVNYVACDLDGELSPCHSTMYEAFSEHRICNIRDIDLINKIDKTTKKYRSLLDHMNDECKTCNVLYCMKCPAGNYCIPSSVARVSETMSKETQYAQRWTRKNINMCKVFKINDAIHKSLLKALEKL